MQGLTNFRYFEPLQKLGDLKPEGKYDEIIYQVDEIGIDRELSSRRLIEYVELAWSEVLPSDPFIRTWSLEAVCDHLQAVADGEITRLVINVPPGTTKSLSACVFFPSWLWTRKPDRRFIYASYNDQLSRRDSLRMRQLISSEWYQARWGHIVKPNTQAEWSGRYFSNMAGGFRKMTTIGGGVTGEHAHIQVVDDPIKPFDITGSLAVSKTALETVTTWYNETMASRLVDFKKSARIIIMQRLHQGDLAGHVLANDDYEHLMLPMEYEPARKCLTSIGFKDPRKEEGDLLCPERFSEEAVATLSRELGPRAAQAQLQQNPTPATGNIFLRDYIQFYTERPKRIPVTIQSWDCTFKETGTSYVAGQVWGMVDTDYYLLDQVRRRMGLSETCAKLAELSLKWPKSTKKLIEDKANGAAVVDVMKKKVSGLTLVNPQGGKEARANAVEPLWSAGNVWLPHPSIAPWIEVFIEELIAFPAGVNDDQVDSMTQALTYLQRKNINRLRAAMANVRI